MTCSGADTRDLTRVQRTFGDARIPPQLRAVTADTDLVTLGIGGNDLDLFSTLVSTCTRLRASDPQGSPCARQLAARGPDLDAAVTTISRRVAASLRAIKAKAPRAKVLLVGYLRLAPDRGTCVGAAAGRRRLRRGPADQPGPRPGAEDGRPPHRDHVRRHVRRLTGPRHLLEGPVGQRQRQRPAEGAGLPPVRRPACGPTPAPSSPPCTAEPAQPGRPDSPRGHPPTTVTKRDPWVTDNHPMSDERVGV